MQTTLGIPCLVIVAENILYNNRLTNIFTVFHYQQNRSLHVLVILIVKQWRGATIGLSFESSQFINPRTTIVYESRRVLQTPLNKKIFFIAPTIQANPKSSTAIYTRAVA